MSSPVSAAWGSDTVLASLVSFLDSMIRPAKTKEGQELVHRFSKSSIHIDTKGLSPAHCESLAGTQWEMSFPVIKTRSILAVNQNIHHFSSTRARHLIARDHPILLSRNYSKSCSPSSQNTWIPSAFQSQAWFPHYAPSFNPEQAKNDTSLQVPLPIFPPQGPRAAPGPTAVNAAQASISAIERVTFLHLWG